MQMYLLNYTPFINWSIFTVTKCVWSLPHFTFIVFGVSVGFCYVKLLIQLKCRIMLMDAC